MIELTQRDQIVLEAIITDYIETGEPVGSRTISKRSVMNVSPATIRNVMADLEEMGLLHQPHTSAGRIPTVKGLRLYLDSIMRSRQLGGTEKERIRGALQNRPQDIAELLRGTSLLLSQFCRQAGVVLWPRQSIASFKHIEFLRLGPNDIMVILISKAGLVHQTHIESKEEIVQAELDKYSLYINELLRNVPFSRVKQRIREEMEGEKALFDRLFSRALQLANRAIQYAIEDSSIYIEGKTNLLDNPEFAHVEQMRRILQAFEDKSKMIRLLDEALKASTGIQIVLGTEGELLREWQEMSLVSAPFRRGDTPLGVLGVIGPLRMDYSRIIPIVEFTAQFLSQMLEIADEA
ncbi:MAG: heat-inducible transcriptional repressor HrcA [Syntrophobacteraceae bacterium]|nr:heat-inducible transcriptional repressor HrcA [Syntrophobacteraceae bacterium]